MDTIIKDVLTKVRERISTPERWTTQFFAKDINNLWVDMDSEKAVCWCLSGAIYVETTPDRNRCWVINKLLNTKIIEYTNYRYDRFIGFNDSSTHTEVLAFLDWVIAGQA